MKSHQSVTGCLAIAMGCSIMLPVNAEVKLGQLSSNGLTAIIIPTDSSERGKPIAVYMGAMLGEQLYLRQGDNMRNWQPYFGGKLVPAIEGIILDSELSVTVVDFDITGLIEQGLEVYVGYEQNQGELFTPGHLGKIASKGSNHGATTGNNPTNTTSGNPACDTTKAPAGIEYSIEGNRITVTTQGKCIPVPDTALCTAPAPTQATGVSMLSTMLLSSFNINGISINISGFPNPFEETGKALANAKTCLMNAPASYNYIIDADVCYDITNKIDASKLQGAGAFISVTPPITEAFEGTIDNVQVNDCFSSGAVSIFDALSKETWIKQADGSYLKIVP